MSQISDAVTQARTQYRLCFNSMAVNPFGWYLFAVKEGVRLEYRANDVPKDVIVANVAALSEEQMASQARLALKACTPIAWLGGMLEVRDGKDLVAIIHLDRVRMGTLQKPNHYSGQTNQTIQLYEDDVENKTRRVFKLTVGLRRDGKLKGGVLHPCALHVITGYDPVRKCWGPDEMTYHRGLGIKDAKPAFQQMRAFITDNLVQFDGGFNWYAKP